MIPKPGKSLNEVISYRPISLLPFISKVFEKLIAKRLKRIIYDLQLLPEHQFGFRDKHSTLDQIHRITNMVEAAFENKKVCSVVLLDVSQVFDRVWHEGLMCKLRGMLLRSFNELIESYLQDRCFRVRLEDTYSSYRKISAGVPQGSVLGPILYLLFTADIPKNPDVKVATFADDTAVLAIGSDVAIATTKLQTALNRIVDWTVRWRIKLNENKSQHIKTRAPAPNYN